MATTTSTRRSKRRHKNYEMKLSKELSDDDLLGEETNELYGVIV